MLLDTLEEGAFVLAENLIEPAIVKVPAENICKFLPNTYKKRSTYMNTSVSHNLCLQGDSFFLPGQLFPEEEYHFKNGHILLTSQKDLAKKKQKNKQTCPHRQFISNMISFI